jgi:hypothetical protein
MTDTNVLIKEIQALPPVYMSEVMDFIAYLKRKRMKNTAVLERAAALAYDDYRNDKELTAFSTLDGEDFYLNSPHES